MKKLLDNKIVQLGLTAFGVIAACILFGFCLFHVSKILSFFGMLVRILMPLISKRETHSYECLQEKTGESTY